MSKRVFLISGANSGVGYATAQTIVAKSENYHVILACRNVASGEQALRDIKESSAVPVKGTLSLVQLDVTDEASVKAAAQTVEKEFGRLDALLNNAGVSDPQQAPYNKERLQMVFEVNVFGPVLMVQAFEHLLEKSTHPAGPYIIQLTSELGSLTKASNPNDTHYAYPNDSYRMTKAAVNMFTVQTHKHLGEGKGFKVFAVCPGLVRSNLRGKSEAARTAGGLAGDPMVSAQTILDVLEGKRDDSVGGFVNGGGVYPW